MVLVQHFLVSEDLSVGAGNQRDQPALVPAVIEQCGLLTIAAVELLTSKGVPDGNIQSELLGICNSTGQRHSTLHQCTQLSEETASLVLDAGGVGAVRLNICIAIEQVGPGNANLVEVKTTIVDSIEPTL